MDTNRYVDQLNFDRELLLDELIIAADSKAISTILGKVLSVDYQIKDMLDQTLLGNSTCENISTIPLIIELEPIGYLIAATIDKNKLEIAKSCLLMQLKFAQKYLMASALHIEAIQEDYNNLHSEHEQLLESEAKYKTLSEDLDDKVKSQVQIIESTQRHLFESEKMASIGHLAAGVAHEINNPIGFINSNLNSAKSYINDFKLLGEKLKKSVDISEVISLWENNNSDFILDDFDDLLADCLDGGQRIASIVADLKLFSNIDAEEEVVTDINKYITRSCNVVRSSLGNNIEIIFEQNPLPNTLCRPGYIGQVILALAINASEAMNNNGSITITSFTKDNKIYITVKDNGPGIPSEVINKVFDPFFTTKDVGQGKGLGLTSCRDIVIAHGGKINIESHPTTGTKVTLWLPVSLTKEPLR